ncbi:TPA: hypothetical protein DIC21_02035 [Candidatus Uhrbacteria bacterium]|nr:hypothetical protein [Candidatus Uhrbacteria bacterium]
MGSSVPAFSRGNSAARRHTLFVARRSVDLLVPRGLCFSEAAFYFVTNYEFWTKSRIYEFSTNWYWFSKTNIRANLRVLRSSAKED